MKISAYLFPALLVLLTLIGCAQPFGGNQSPREQVAVITTDKGIVAIEFYPDSAPVAVENFKKLINQKFYDGLTLHRKVDAPGLNIIQGSYFTIIIFLGSTSNLSSMLRLVSLLLLLSLEGSTSALKMLSMEPHWGELLAATHEFVTTAL